jgi:hypothetical protein
MEVNREAVVEAEVLGIVISRGARTQTEPRFSMYVWGPAPDAEPDSTTKAA